VDDFVAGSILREALDIRQRALPAGDTGIAQAESVLGACLSTRGHDAETEALLFRGYRTLQAARRCASVHAVGTGAAGRPTPTRVQSVFRPDSPP
jgi:hypothetical protein